MHVTVSLADLQARTGCGEVIGSSATGTILSPEVLRRVCCEADLIPHVLGTAGEDLDLGRVVRLFTRAQRRRLWRRDRGLHLPRVRGAGGVDQGAPRGALGRRRRHRRRSTPRCSANATTPLVHTRRLIAEVRAKPDERGRYVIWDLTPGSYDRHLERLHAERAAHDPPALTPERLRELLAVVAAGTDLDQQRFAELELSEAALALEDLQRDGRHPRRALARDHHRARSRLPSGRSRLP